MLEIGEFETPIIWPWDALSWLWETGRFNAWLSDSDASAKCQEYWDHIRHLDSYDRLGLSQNQHASCVPLYVHADGVKAYKNQKAWTYSFASACKRGTSLKSKFVVLLLKESRIVKNMTHDSIAGVMAYIFDTLQSGVFPLKDYAGADWPKGSTESLRAGRPICGHWRFAFAGFKGDCEARVLIHKFERNYWSRNICRRCPASRDPGLQLR